MRCAFPDCLTILSEYNEGKLCRLHTRVLFQHDVEYERGRFFRIIDVTKRVKNKIRVRQKKEFLPTIAVKRLKELVNINDILAEDRLPANFPKKMPLTDISI